VLASKGTNLGANLEAAILAHISKQPHARASLKQLYRELGARGGERRNLDLALARLTARGDLVEPRPGHYLSTVQSTEYIAGRLRMHRDGFGFVIADHPSLGISGDIYISREDASRAMHGDRVLVRLGRVESDGRASGSIVKVLTRAHATLVGQFRVTRRGCVVVPHDDRIRQWIRIPEGLELPGETLAADRVGAATTVPTEPADLDGAIVNVEILEFPDDAEPGVGRVIELLGFPDEFGVDVEIIIRKHHIPHRFPPDVLAEAAAAPAEVVLAEVGGRRDFRAFDIVTIDGETARDFDDAVWVDRLPNGNFELQVHIADVSHYVAPGSAIDREARLRGTSVYFPDRAVPMLPIELSTGICSLKPMVDRLVVSALLEIDPHGDLVSQDFTRSIIKSAARMTYTDVHALLEGDAALREQYAALTPRFELMRELALVLNRKRVRRGSIDFDLPEPLIEFDKFGEMTGVIRGPRNIAHRIIEEFMLAANEAVASHLEHLGRALLFRIHEPPDPRRVAEFDEAAAQFGYSLGIGSMPRRRGPAPRDIAGGEVSSRTYQRLIRKFEGKPEERILSYLMLRSFKQARYSEQNLGHFALAATSYTHFTSPIRRYPDLIVHRALTAALDLANEPYTPSELRAIAQESSEAERRAAEAERDLVEWKKARFMEDRLGEEFPAMILNTAKFGFFVELQDLFIEGLVPIETLPGERFHFHEATRKIVGARSRISYSAGDRVTVRLDRIDPIDHKLTFALVPPPSTRRARPNRKK
jgi:ribonuclease R